MRSRVVAAGGESIVAVIMIVVAHTCPAVSMISVAYSWPLYLITLEKVFSMVG